MKGISLFLILVACFPLPAESHGSIHVLFQNEDLVLSGEIQLEAEAKYLGRTYAEVRADLEKTVGLPFRSKPRVLLVRNQELFQNLAGSGHITAFAVPDQHLIVIHISPSTSQRPLLNDIFKHELCHLLLHDHIREQRIPKWLDEGICQWVSGSVGELLVGDRAPISRIEMAYRLIPLNSISLTFPSEKELLFLAYRQSQDFLGYLAAHYGAESIRAILKHLKDGADINHAMQISLSKPFPEVETEWAADMKSRSEWLIWASRNLYEILFTVAALLTILAAVRLKMRRAKYVDEEEEN